MQKLHFNLFWIFLLLGAIPVEAQIQSTTAGGAWNEGNTWVGSIVPGPGDDVVINGPVYVTIGAACNSITVSSSGTLTSYGSASWTLTVNGNILNNGIICDNTTANTRLYLNVYGNIENHATWTNYGIYAFGDADSYIGSDQPFEVEQFHNNKTSGDFLALSGLVFNSTVINFNFKSLIFVYGYSLDLLNMSELRDITIGQGTTLHCDGTGLLYNVTGSTVSFTGEHYIGGGCSFNEVYNNGILQNWGATNYSVAFNGSLFNYGEIRDSPYGGYLLINFDGTLSNEGVWTNHLLNANGIADQLIFATTPFEVDYFDNNNTTGNISVISDVIFKGTTLRFYNRNLVVGGNILTLEGPGYAHEVAFLTGYKTIQSDDNYYFTYSSFDNTNLSGTFNAGAQCVFTNGLTNNGTLQNVGGSSSTIQVLCDITNHGVIRNHPMGGHLDLEITGNINHQGTSWENHETRLNGSSDQYVYMYNYHDIYSSVKLLSMISATGYLWYRSGIAISGSDPLFSGYSASTLGFIQPASPVYKGEYQCLTNNGDSRLIFIQPIVTDITVDVRAYLQGPFSGASMITSLNQGGQLPLNQPYNTSPWYYNGLESMVSVPSPDIVDWVLVELRDAADAASANSATFIGRQAGLINASGHITGVDGMSPLNFPGLTFNYNLFIVVRHRNHLAVMNAVPPSYSSGVYSYDFSYNGNSAFGGVQAHKEVAPGFWAMIAADGNSDNQVNNGDKNDVWAQQAGGNGYLQGDFNMDSQVNNTDKNELWKPNTGLGGQVPN
ncbi:MAG: hypothetical protein JXA03_10900 [Bacteroidales bacterium]|nr:hypothetical protein [Bacteroidales bacterium]